MIRTLFPLALQGLFRRRKSSVLIFLVLLLSFAFAIVSLSLLGSIQKTNEEFRKDTYGDWYFAIPEGTAGDATQFAQWDWVTSYGRAQSYGTLTTSTTLSGFGTVEEELIDLGRLSLDAGHWPEEADEIVLEADVLSALGYDYTLGQQVTLTLTLPDETAITHTFLLCGIVGEFSDLWAQGRDSTPVSAITTPETAEALSDSARSTTQYYIQVSETTLEEETARKAAETQLSDYLKESRGDGTDISYLTNGAILSTGEETVQNQRSLCLIALVALAAVLCVYLLGLSGELQRCATLRSLGMTRPQLLVFAMEEAVLLLVPGVILGIPLGMGLTWAGLKIAAFSGSRTVVVQVPYGQLISVTLLWLAVAVGARLVLFALAVRVPLTGRFQVSRKNARMIGFARNVLAVIPLLVLGTAVFLAGFECIIKNDDRQDYANLPHYVISGTENEAGQQEAIPESAAEELGKIAGVTSVTSYSYGDVTLSYAGLGERQVQLVVLDEDQMDQWDEALQFGASYDTFRRGKGTKWGQLRL